MRDDKPPDIYLRRTVDRVDGDSLDLDIFDPGRESSLSP